MDEKKLHKKFDKIAKTIIKSVTPFLKDQFGPECKEFEPDCICCQRWKALRVLTENPYSNE